MHRRIRRFLVAQRRPALYHVYIDAFAEQACTYRKSTGQLSRQSFECITDCASIQGVPPDRSGLTEDGYVRQLTDGYNNVNVYDGDCNTGVTERGLPRVKYEDYRRGLLSAGPYGLHLDWAVVQMASVMRSIEIFLNFPVMDMNRNVLWGDPKG